jgi:hypothetical protein
MINAESSLSQSVPEAKKEQEKSLPVVETENGVSYKYLSDGTVAKSKSPKGGFWPLEQEKITGPIETLVFLPDYDTLMRINIPGIVPRLRFGEDEKEYTRLLNNLMKKSDFNGDIVNEDGVKLKNNVEIRAQKGGVYLVLDPHTKVPVAKMPREKFYAFEAKESDGERVCNLEGKVEYIK